MNYRLNLMTLAIGMYTLITVAAHPTHGDQVVVANRSSGSISVLDVGSHGVTTHALPTPAGGNTPEPMYVVYMPDNRRVYVGDRANDRVVIFDPADYSVVGDIAAGAGVFHMWGDPADDQLWVVNDIDKSITVLDTASNSPLATFSTPADLNSAGGKPHDVILDPNGPFGYVTMVGLNASLGHDSVVKFEHLGGTTFSEVDRADTGGDPHLSLTAQNSLLYLPTQVADQVRVLNRGDLSFVTDIAVDNAHGVSMLADGSRLYVTNISDGGASGLFTIDTATNIVLDTDDTPVAVPHNIALSPDNRELYITHSGVTGDQVSIYSLADPSNPIYVTSVTVGSNPFGIAAVPEPTSATLAALATLSFGILRIRRKEPSVS